MIPTTGGMALAGGVGGLCFYAPPPMPLVARDWPPGCVAVGGVSNIYIPPGSIGHVVL